MTWPGGRLALVLAPIAAALPGLGAAQDPAAAPRVIERPAEPQTMSEHDPQPELVLERVAFPSLEGLDPDVADRLRLARTRLRLALQEARSRQEVGAAFGELGQLLQAYDFVAAASSCYRNAARLVPTDARWPHYLGLMARDQGETEAALELFARAVALGDPTPAVHVYQGQLLYELGRVDEALATLEQVAGEHGDPAAGAQLGEILLAQGKTEQAIELLEGVLARVPEVNRLHYPLARAYREVGDAERASEHLEQAGSVGIRPVDPLLAAIERLRIGERSHIERGRRAYAAGQLAAAAEEFRLAVAASPTSVIARVNLATALAGLGEADQALEQLERSLELDPSNRTARYNLASLLLAAGRFEEALAHFESVLVSAPDDLGARLGYARSLRRLGRAEQAIEQFELARRSAPNAPGIEEAWLTEAQIRIERGDEEGAVRLLERGVEVLPNRAEVLAALARLLATVHNGALRDGERALALARRAFELDETPWNAESVSLALAEQDRCAEALAWVTIAFERTTGEADLRRRLALARERYGVGPPCRAALSTDPD